MNDAYALWQLTRRNLKIFLKDKANVFFSLLSPLIVLALYALFLGRVQADSLLGSLAEMGIGGADEQIRRFCDSWMLAGAVSCACITVPLCACGIMIQDKARGIVADLSVSPAPAWITLCSYFLSVIAAGLVIGVFVLAVCFIWLAASGSWLLSVTDVFGCIGALVVSVISSSALLVFVMSFFSSQGAFTAMNVIVGTVVGFFIGAYMPVTMFPKAIQDFTLFIPGSYTAGLFRNFMMQGAIDEIAANFSPQFAASLEEQFSLSFDFFGATVRPPAMFIVLALVAVVFIGAFCLAAVLKNRKK